MSDNPSPFSGRTVILLVIAGIVGFIVFLLLSAYAPGLRSGRDGRAHGLSTSAVGFRGVYELLETTGADVQYLRDDNIFSQGGLTVVTIEPGIDTERLQDVIDTSWGPLLIVLPKWTTLPVQGERDRVQWVDYGSGGSAIGPLSQVADFRVDTDETEEAPSSSSVSVDCRRRKALPAVNKNFILPITEI